MSVYYQVSVFYESATHPAADYSERRATHHDRETFEDPDDILPWLRKHLPVTEDTLKYGGKDAFRFRHGEEVMGRTFGYWCGPDRSGNRWYEWATVVVERVKNEPATYSEVVA